MCNNSLHPPVPVYYQRMRFLESACTFIFGPAGGEQEFHNSQCGSQNLNLQTTINISPERKSKNDDGDIPSLKGMQLHHLHITLQNLQSNHKKKKHERLTSKNTGTDHNIMIIIIQAILRQLDEAILVPLNVKINMDCLQSKSDHVLISQDRDVFS